MFFNSKRELEVSRIFGITGTFGIKLINQKHPFPYFVEQEERYHGAFISITTYGGVFRAFDSISRNEENPAIPESFAVPALARSKGSEIYNLCRAIRRKVLDNSVQVHESFAKYIACARQVEALKGLPVELKQLLMEEFDRYPALKTLIEILGWPEPDEGPNSRFQRDVAYLMAKWILNSEELDFLYEKNDLLDFRSVMEQYLFSRTKMTERHQDALDFLRLNPDTLREKFEIQNYNEEVEYASYGNRKLKELYDFIGESLPQHAHVPLYTPVQIYAKIAAIVHKIALLEIPINSFLSFDFVKTSLLGTTLTVETIDSPALYASMFSSDLALRVRYDQKYTDGRTWRFFDQFHEAADLLRHQVVDHLLVYPSLADNGEIDCFLTARVFYRVDSANVTHQGIGNFVCRKKTLKEALLIVDAFKARETSLVLLPAQSADLADFDEVSKCISRYGKVLFWAHNADLFALYHLKGSHFLLATELFLAEAQRVMNIPVHHPYMSVTLEDNFCFFSSAPAYYADVISAISKLNPNNPYLSGFEKRIVAQVPGSSEFRYLGSGVLDITGKQKDVLNSAIKAYQLIYEMEALPTYLPLYEANKMFELIKNIPHE